MTGARDPRLPSVDERCEAPAIGAALAATEDLGSPLPCPLCDYDLRGLPAGRCPECGHAFDPAEMRLKARTAPQRLFEHHRRRPVRSFLRTLITGWRPKRFWATLTPSAPIVPRRLAMYAVLVLLLGTAGAMAGFVTDVAQETRRALEQRKQYQAYYAAAPPQRKLVLDQSSPGGSYIAYNNAWVPLPAQSQFWQRFQWQAAALRGVPLACLVVAWPAFTLATLLIFRRSLRQAKIHFAHVARIVIYSADVFSFTLLVLLVMLALEWVDLLPLNYTIYSAPDPVSALFQILPGVNGVVLMTSLLLLLLAGWRLMRSYQLYLRFPHAIATVLASQIIVWLALVTLGAPVLEFLQDLLL